MLTLTILFYIIVALIEGVSLIKRRYWRELITFFVFWGVAFVLSIIYTLGFNIPSPAGSMKYIVEDIFRLKYPQ